MIKGGLDSEPGQRLIYDLRNVYHLRLQFVRGSEALIFETLKQRLHLALPHVTLVTSNARRNPGTVIAVVVEERDRVTSGQRRRPCLRLRCRADRAPQNW